MKKFETKLFPEKETKYLKLITCESELGVPKNTKFKCILFDFFHKNLNVCEFGLEKVCSVVCQISSTKVFKVSAWT